MVKRKKKKKKTEVSWFPCSRRGWSTLTIYLD
jgi:hypothetical protein